MNIRTLITCVARRELECRLPSWPEDKLMAGRAWLGTAVAWEEDVRE